MSEGITGTYLSILMTNAYLMVRWRDSEQMLSFLIIVWTIATLACLYIEHQDRKATRDYIKGLKRGPR